MNLKYICLQETQGLAFNRASQYIRTATADLLRAHSRPTSKASQSLTPHTPPQGMGERASPNTSANSKCSGAKAPPASRNVDVQEVQKIEIAEQFQVDTETSTPRNQPTTKKENYRTRSPSAVNIHVPTSY